MPDHLEMCLCIHVFFLQFTISRLLDHTSGHEILLQFFSGVSIVFLFQYFDEFQVGIKNQFDVE